MKYFIAGVVTFLVMSLGMAYACRADALSLSFGPSVDDSIGGKKALELGYEFRSASPSLIIETGAISEQASHPTFYGGANFGVHVVTPDGLSMRAGVGPALISQTDDRLSSHFEFHIQARVGLQMDSWGVGVQFDHFSNAGFVPPNLGLDLAAVFIGVPL